MDGNSFAILELTDSTYIQSGLKSGGEYVIEYQQGSLQEHFQAFTADADKVIKALQAYAIESDSWQSMFEWQQIELRTNRHRRKVAVSVFPATVGNSRLRQLFVPIVCSRH